MIENADLNSCSYIIRNGILDRLKLIPTFQSVRRWSTGPMLRVQAQLQAEQIPFVGVYLVEETMGPDGDANHAEPRFVHTVKLGFSVIITAPDEQVAERNLDSAHWTIMNLLTNERWHKFPANGAWLDNVYTNKHEDIHIESVTRGARKHVFGNRMINNDTPTAELQMELTVLHRTSFPPIIPDTLNMIHVTVAYPWPYDPNLHEAFTVQYDLPVLGAFTADDYSLLPPSFAKPVLGGLPLKINPYSLASPSFATPTLTIR
jgi:hypothetical protein